MLDPHIAISGAAGGEAAEQGRRLAEEVGRQIAIHGGIVTTGATSGIPYHAAKGAKDHGGAVVGFSPAQSYREHIHTYRLPTLHHDQIFFTGQDYAGRDITLVEFSDAVIEISGRIGTIHEFTHAFERHKIIGILLHSGGTIDEIPGLLEMAHRGKGKVIMDDDPKRLVKAIFSAIDKMNE